jgi:hypothetical protein
MLVATKALFSDPTRTEEWLVKEHDIVFTTGLTTR